MTARQGDQQAGWPTTFASISKPELIWPGKYDAQGRRREVERVHLPFQVVESVNSPAASSVKQRQPTLFDVWEAREGNTFDSGWKNKLIWGDNLLVMGSLLEKLAGKVNLIYIDPPFATGADFSFRAEVGDGSLEMDKQQSLIEEKAYRDTWGRGLSSYLDMMYDRLVLMHELLAQDGTIYVHAGWQANSHLRLLLDEIFGPARLIDEVVWHYETSSGAPIRSLIKNHATLLHYAKSDSWTFNPIREPWPEDTLKKWQKDEDGRIYRVQNKFGKRYYINPEGKLSDDVWNATLASRSYERTNYPTQKPEALLEKVISISSNPGDLVADVFCGSGTTLAVAEKLGRRWIGCDLSRYAVHVSRKRLMGIEGCKPFEVLNLGKYERQYWQGVTFGPSRPASNAQLALFEYVAFILKLYGAEPLAGLRHLHGKKASAVVHVGPVDAPVTIDEILACIEECAALHQRELHVLGWEWEMGLYGLMADQANRRGVKLMLLTIPREVMDPQAVARNDVQFFELAYLRAEVSVEDGQRVTVRLADFVIPNTELIPPEVRKKVTKWSDYVDYWAVDWNFANDTFRNGWVAFRTRRDRRLPLEAGPHVYERPGRYEIMVKVVDIFGNDTSQVYSVEVR